MLLRHQMKTPIWPYIVVVACLFVLSLLAPRTWLARQPEPAPPPLTAAPAPPPPHLPTLLQPSFAEQPTVLPSEPASSVTVSLAAQIDESLEDLDQFFGKGMQAEVASIQPPVGEQIKLDVSVTDTPALPIESPLTPQPAPAASSGESSDASASSAAVQEQEETESTPRIEKRVPTLPQVSGAIPRSEELLAALSNLAQDPQAGHWGGDLFSTLERIYLVSEIRSQELNDLFLQLFRLIRDTPRVADQVKTLDQRAKVLRLGYALKRRLDVWYQVRRILTQKDVPVLESGLGMRDRLQAVEARLAQAEHAAEWHKYLLLDEVRNLIGPGDAQSRRELAKRILKRIDSPQLSAAQVAVFQKAPFDEFSLELRRWSAEPLDYLRLLAQIEEYERTSSTASATTIASCYDVLRWSPQPELQKLGDLLNTHYRNANFRVALTAEFLNRLLPDPQAYQQDINNTIAGADVYGTSHTVNRLQVVLHPDSETWRIGLEAHGEVASDTTASKGPATFYNQGFSRYHARKLLMIDRRGIRVWRAEADANSESQLTGFETDFDPVPILGWLARSVARSQHDQQYYSAKVETEEMVRAQATLRFDEEVHERLAAAETKVKEKLLRPFENLDLKPTPLDMATTEQRVIARYRLAADRQLGAQTPRPQAPADSLLSVQVHESALNNTLANLKLEGRRTTLHELYREIAVAFERPDLKFPEDISETMVIEFAEQEAVRVRCDEGRVTLTIRVAELKDRRFKRTDFAVKAHYVPTRDQLSANLVREGGVEISGERLGNCLALRVIFSKVLSESKGFDLINQRIAENAHLSDCHVNQFVINDGWVGVGIGPTPAYELDQMARQKNAELK